MLLKLVIFISVFSSTGILCWQVYPLFAKRAYQYQSKSVQRSVKTLDAMFVRVPGKKLFLLHSLVPLALGGIVLLVTGEIVLALIVGAFGLALPTLVLKRLQAQRKSKFRSQLVDGLMILSSSLKGGLSLFQSIEALVEEMPEPISQEFGLVLRENKMGIPLDESLEHLNKRMDCEELNLVVTAIQLARETGGSLPRIFGQFVSTFREKTKLLGKIKALTVQGKMQGVILGLLPIVFAVSIYFINPKFFTDMMQSEKGRLLLGYAMISETIGIILLNRLSKVEV